jgi:Uma2 family endonuclease
MVVRAFAKSRPAEQRFRVSGVPWSAYVAFGESICDVPIRATYDRGEMELMTTSPKHERSDRLLGYLVLVLCEETETRVVTLGRMTFQRDDLERAMEADNCFWIQNEASVRDKDELDLDVDPPPDLVPEIEVSRSLLDRMGILLALRVPEVWTSDAEVARAQVLSRGRYREAEYSRAFPFLRIADLNAFLKMRRRQDDQTIVRAFRKWVREQQAKGWPKKGKN